jgi:putative proteasome-type protease
MTYCVGLLLDAGLVMMSDTRTNAGLDNISIYRKMFVFEEPGERVIAIMTAGSLSITQTVISKLRHDIASSEASAENSILLAETMLDVVELIGQTLSDVSVSIGEKMARMDSKWPSASLIVGGQRKGGNMRLFLVYPEGNFIEATEDTPYFQIGEHKYGKPILDRVVTPDTSIEEGRKVALLSMDSTMRSNLSVGMPLDLLTVRRDAYRVAGRERIEAGDPIFSAMSEAWSRALRDAFLNMPA